MLINKGFSNGDVVSVKLINGDELIARFESEDADTITISKPMAITMGVQGMGLIPWVFLGDTERNITLRKKHTFFIVPSKKEASDQYIEGTTGIAIVK